MGKPFNSEITKIQETYDWAWKIEENDIKKIFINLENKVLLTVGSGGATCCACFLSLLHQNKGFFSSFITPLELISSKKSISRDINVALISASGKNSDINFALDLALEEEPNYIFNFCLKKDSKLKKRSLKYSIVETFEDENPQGKDGFLATNSTIAFFTIFSRIYGNNHRIKNLLPSKEYIESISNFAKSLNENFTIIVLYSSWSKPVAIDLESKFSEAGIGNILLTDYRNFGHGRHNWLDKKTKQTGIISLITPDVEKLAIETIKYIPSNIPIFKMITQEKEASASIDLLAKSFFVVNEFGKKCNIDPGKPGVPDYGSKLYNLKYASYLKDNNKVKLDLKTALKRKFGNIDSTDNTLYESLKNSYETFINKLKKQNFNTIIFDYDGTLCSKEERFLKPKKEIIEKLNFLLENNIIVAIVSGRGKSVREIFEDEIHAEFKNNFFVGYYNGYQIGTLNDSSLPISKNEDKLLDKITNELTLNECFKEFLNIDTRKGQITITFKKNNNSELLKGMLRDFIKNTYDNEILVLESSHSIDIIDSKTSKNNMLDYLKDNINKEIIPLCIGDKGIWPGNDYKLLSNEFSLSVDEVSKDFRNCWNLSSLGNRGVSSTLEYLNSIVITKNGFKLKI